jgi:hypothetical protein
VAEPISSIDGARVNLHEAKVSHVLLSTQIRYRLNVLLPKTRKARCVGPVIRSSVFTQGCMYFVASFLLVIFSLFTREMS